MTSALKEELKKWLKQLAADERKDPARYHDSGMLFRLPNGLAVEPVLIRKKFLKWQDAHPEFPRIVFHGLRHSSATYQLMISGGDVKAVQGTTGHATADMLVNTYAHIQQSSRVELGRKFEEGFYAKSDDNANRATIVSFQNCVNSIFLSFCRKFAFCVCCILCTCYPLLHPLSSRSGVQKCAEPKSAS